MKSLILLLFFITAIPSLAQTEFYVTDNRPVLSIVKQDNHYGLKDQRTDSVYYHDLDTALIFNGNAAYGFLVSRNYKYGIITNDGSICIPLEFDKIDILRRARYLVTKGDWKGIYECNKVIIPCEQDSIAISFNERTEFVFKKDKLWGIYDHNGELVIPNAYNQINISSKSIELKKKNKKYYWVNKSIISQDSIDVSRTFSRKSNYPSNDLFYKVGTSNQWGIVDKSWNYIVKPHYQDIFYHPQYDIFFLKQKDKWGIVDFEGNTILPLVNDSIAGYDGLIMVKNNGVMNFYDLETKNQYSNPVFDDIKYVDATYYKISLKGKKTLVDKQFKILLPFLYDDVFPYKNGMFSFVSNKKYGVLNQKGEVLIPAQYDWLHIYADLVFVQQQSKWGALGLNNKVLLPVIYQAVEPRIDYIEVYKFNSGVKYKLNYKLECIDNCVDFKK